MTANGQSRVRVSRGMAELGIEHVKQRGEDRRIIVRGPFH